MWAKQPINPNESYWDYRCDGCGQLRHWPFREKPTQCGNQKCDSKMLTVGRPGTLNQGMGATR